jgi:gamma-glutamyltranspeptidase/glutathione hydrolase
MWKMRAGSTTFPLIDMVTITQPVAPETRESGCASGHHTRLQTQGAVATAFPLATDAAIETLQAGGNAMDAAIAAAWALSVCEPASSGVGGQTTLLFYKADGTIRVIDGHSYAPKGASLEAITKSKQRNGYRSCTIPSTPATLEYARRKYGTLPSSQLLVPAIRIAEEGYPITTLQHRQARWAARYLRESAETSRFFLRDGAPMPEGAIFRQPVLARTLRRLGDESIEDFYHGHIAGLIAEDMRQNGGLITEEDLATCDLPVERAALCSEYRGYEVLTAPSPGGGLQVLLALRFLEEFAPRGFSGDLEEWYEAIALAIYSAFREREKSPLSPEAATPSHTDWVLDKDRVRRLAARLQEHTVSIDEALSGVEEPGDTTHLTVADGAGSVVALTQSIQSLFGAKVANASLGFLYNNYLRTCPRKTHPYQLGSRCQPRSNCAPTIVLKKGTVAKVPVLALGAAGSRRITSAIAQVASAVIDRALTITEAVAAPRVHALLSKKVWIERPAANESLLKKLEERSMKPIIRRALNYDLASVQALQWLPDGNLLGAADPRRDGTARVLGRPRTPFKEP